MSEPFTLTCPNCAQIDRIQKVTSIVADGTKTTGSTTTKTDLAQKLSFRVAFSSTWKVNFPGAVFLTMLGGALIVGGWIVKVTRFDGTELFFGILSTVIGALIASWGLYFLVNWLIYPALMRKRSQDKQTRYEQQALQYQKAQNAYSNLFYCYRCDGVFTKESNFVPIEQAQVFLNRGELELFSKEDMVKTSESESVTSWPSVNDE